MMADGYKKKKDYLDSVSFTLPFMDLETGRGTLNNLLSCLIGKKYFIKNRILQHFQQKTMHDLAYKYQRELEYTT